MRKPYFMVNRKSAVRMGAVLSLTICMALQTAGCSSAGKGGEQTTAAQDAGEAAKDKAPEGAGQTDGEAAAGETRPDAGEAAADEAQADAGQGEGDSGIEAQPGVPLKAGNKAPDFTAELIDGSSLALSDLKGKPVIINFWATWCGPCVREMPAFERLKEDFGDEIGIIAVNCGDDADTVKDFVDENGYTFPVALDENYEVAMLYPSNSIPYTVVLDANGKITHVSTGAYDADTMYDRYKEALGL